MKKKCRDSQHARMQVLRERNEGKMGVVAGYILCTAVLRRRAVR